MRQAVFSVLALFGVTGAAAPAARVDLSFLEGEWTITDAKGDVVGSSKVEEQAANAVLYEMREVGGHQPLWLVNSEPADGWVQLFVGASGFVREFRQTSPGGEWPLVMAGDVVLRDGTPARFRLTMSRPSGDESRRVLEQSLDGGASWKTILDYTYRRAG